MAIYALRGIGVAYRSRSSRKADGKSLVRKRLSELKFSHVDQHLEYGRAQTPYWGSLYDATNPRGKPRSSYKCGERGRGAAYQINPGPTKATRYQADVVRTRGAAQCRSLALLL